MEEKINLIKEKLTGVYETDIVYLSALYDIQNQIIEDGLATIEAIKVVVNEVNNSTQEEVPEEEVKEETEEKKEEPKEEEVQETEEIDPEEIKRQRTEAEIEMLIDDLKHADSSNNDAVIKIVETLIPKIESISKTDEENVIYCSFSSDFEREVFNNIFAGEKEVRQTPYANDLVYITYANFLLNKKRRKSAMESLDRAIYWNFLNREAREMKIDLYFLKDEIVKCLDAIGKLLSISYTAVDIAECYNKYAYVFDSLKDPRSAYALYKLSYSYYEDEKVLEEINKLEEKKPEFKSLTHDDIINIAQDNEVQIGPNANILKAHRDITTKLIEQGAIKEARIMIENDYAMTGDKEIAKIYEQLKELDSQHEEANHQEKKKVVKKTAEKKTEAKSTKTAKAVKTTPKKKADEEVKVEEKPKKETKTTKKTTKSTKTSTTKKSTKTTKK